MAVKQGDTDFLRNYAAGGGTVLVQGPNGQYQQANAAPTTVPLQAAPPTTPLNNSSPQPGTPGAPGQPGQAKQPPLTPYEREQQRLQARREDQRIRQQQQAQKNAASKGFTSLLDMAGKPGEAIRNFAEWAGNLPAPGGIGAMLAALIFLNFAVVPVNEGHTRLELLWMTFLNQTFIPEAQAVEDARDSGQLASEQSVAGPGVNGVVGGILGAAGGLIPGIKSGSSAPVQPSPNGQLPIAPPMSSAGRSVGLPTSRIGV